jgi:DNA invertase Pin-like site-specific DNA recombinase
MTARPLRCAIYTRKSTEHGLEQEFNSLEAQREACEAYVKSQTQEGWRLLLNRYDDGGFSGGSLDRPAVQLLMSAIRERKVDVVVVYKIDRLTRSLADFAKLVELFDAHGVSFVSVTQSFNTTNSMGRLTLNVLLSFAQFEREVTGERIRDKIAASKKKGIRMGGPVPLGYNVKDRKLVPDKHESEQVRRIFRSYLELGCITALAQHLREHRVLTKLSVRRDGTTRGGIPFTKGPLAYLLRNRVYVGEVVHKGRYFPGEHEPIIAADLFEAVQAELTAKAAALGSRKVNEGSLLKGRLFDDRGNGMTPTTSNRNGARYRYYVSSALMQGRRSEAGSVARVPAPEIEALVLSVLEERLNSGAPPGPSSMGGLEERPSRPEMIGATLDRVTVRPGEVEIRHRTDGGEAPQPPLVVRWSPPPARRRRAFHDPGEPNFARPIRADTRARLLERIALARSWLNDILSCRVENTAEIAAREQRTERSIRMNLNLAYLSPKIVVAAIEGSLPDGIGCSLLADTPPSWSEQAHIARLPTRSSSSP